MILVGILSDHEYKFIGTLVWVLVSAAVKQIIENSEAKLEKRENKISLWSLMIDFGSLIFALGYFLPMFWIYWIAGTILMILGVPIYFIFWHRDRK